MRGEGVVANPAHAIAWHRKAARQNHLGAQVALEQMKLPPSDDVAIRGNGAKRLTGAERRKDEARWIKAAETGNADARYHLGLMYQHGLGLDLNLEQALGWYSIAAQQGHAKAQYALAALLEPDGTDSAVSWYSKAAEAGLAEAQSALGRLYQEGRLVRADYLKSQQWYARAANLGSPQALFALSQLLDSDTDTLSFDYCRQAAEGGDVKAMYRLGQKYERGVGVSQNLSKAFAWYESAARQGHTEAASAAGIALLKGMGVAKNMRSAMQWLLQAAEDGDARAQWTLSSVYVGGGEAVARDMKQAFVWCERAARQGFLAAQSNLGLLYAMSNNPEQAAACWQKAAAKGDPEAQYNLAMAHLKGHGVTQDAAQAFSLLQDAAAQGVTQAQSRLGLMFATGEGVAHDPIEAHKWFVIAASNGDGAARANVAHSESVVSAAQALEGQRRASEWKNTKKV